MDSAMVIDLFAQSLWVMITIVSVIILPGLVVGLIVAMFQAATQINEMTLNFIPRLLVTLLALMFASPWLLTLLIEYSTRVIRQIPYVIG